MSGAVGRAAQTFRVTFAMNLKSIIRYYALSGYLISFLLNPIFMILTAWVINGLVAPGGLPDRFRSLTGFPDYLTFVILGYSFNGFLLAAAVRGGSSIYDEQTQGTVELLFLTPMNRFVWMVAKAMSTIFSSVIDLVIVLAFGSALFGLKLHAGPGAVITALLGLCVTTIALQGVSFILGGVGMIFKQSHAIEVFLIPIFTFMSGMLFPVEALPPWLRAFSYSFPLTYGLDVVRKALMLDAGILETWWDFLGLSLCALVYVPAGYLLFNRLERNAKRLGVLTTF